MKYLITTIAAVVLVGCGTTRQSTEAPDAKPEFKSSVSPDDSGTYTLTNSYTGDALTIELKTDGSFLIPPVGSSDKLIGSWKAENELLILEGATEKSSEAIKIKFNKTTGKVVFGSRKQGELQKDELDRLTVKKHEVNKGEELKGIHKAAKDGDIEAIKLHLVAGADVNGKTVYGETPLHQAANGGHKEIVELLIAKGTDVNAKSDTSWTPLHWAVQEGHMKIVELLIAKGADVNAKDKHDITSLHMSSTQGHKGIAELLIAKGADVNVKNKLNGETPLGWAIRANNLEIANLLREHGGK